MKKAILLIVFIFSSSLLFSQATCGFGGAWDTNWDGISCTVKMGMSDKTMWGTYSYYLGGTTVRGELSGKITHVESSGGDAMVTMKGTWSEGEISGTFVFTRVCSKPAFSGTWWNNNGRESGNWAGKQ